MHGVSSESPLKGKYSLEYRSSQWRHQNFTTGGKFSQGEKYAVVETTFCGGNEDFCGGNDGEIDPHAPPPIAPPLEQ